MTENEFKKRTKKVAVRIVNFVESLPSTKTADVLGKQLIRSGTSVGANYRSACRAKSVPDFVAKLAVVEEEADESMYWIELLVESGLVKQRRIDSLYQEIDEILAITVASKITTRTNFANRKSKIENRK